jgi:hypothetical protein
MVEVSTSDVVVFQDGTVTPCGICGRWLAFSWGGGGKSGKTEFTALVAGVGLRFDQMSD